MTGTQIGKLIREGREPYCRATGSATRESDAVVSYVKKHRPEWVECWSNDGR